MHLLGIDLGTSGTKASVVDTLGRTVASATAEHPISIPRPGWSEQDPDWWWRSTIAAVRAAMQRSGLPAAAIGAIGLSGQMHGLVMVDGDGATIRPCILWNDQRSTAQCARVERDLSITRLVEATGNRMLPGFTAPKILWCREQEPALAARTSKYLLPKDWLRWRMSGVYATEVSDASGTLLFDCARRCWSSSILEALGLDRRALPDCAESFEITSHLAPEAASELGLHAGTPIAGGAGDQASAAVGAGIVDEGRVAVTIGTSGVVFAASRAWRASPQGELHAFCHAIPGRWHLMGVMLSAGGSLQWHRDALWSDASGEAAPRSERSYETILNEAAGVAPGAEGITFLPYLSGERCPYPDPHARGALVGLTAAHRRGAISRAIVEGITFGLRDNLDLVRSLGVRADEVLLSGGGARSSVWRQICADIFELPVLTTAGDQGSALGAALIAGAGVGVWPDVAAASAAAAEARSAERVHPSPDTAQYSSARERYRSLYATLRPYFEAVDR